LAARQPLLLPVAQTALASDLPGQPAQWRAAASGRNRRWCRNQTSACVKCPLGAGGQPTACWESRGISTTGACTPQNRSPSQGSLSLHRNTRCSFARFDRRWLDPELDSGRLDAPACAGPGITGWGWQAERCVWLRCPGLSRPASWQGHPRGVWDRSLRAALCSQRMDSFTCFRAVSNLAKSSPRTDGIGAPGCPIALVWPAGGGLSSERSPRSGNPCAIA